MRPFVTPFIRIIAALMFAFSAGAALAQQPYPNRGKAVKDFGAKID